MFEAKRPLAALALAAAVGLSACGSSATPKVPPSATLQPLAGSPSGRIVLTALGARRIGVQTALVRSAVRAPKPAAPVGGPTVIVPYSSLIYAPDGSIFAFTSQSPLVFAEVPVTVDHIDGSSAYLTKGPLAGTKVVTTGAEELFGVQTGVLPQT